MRWPFGVGFTVTSITLAQAARVSLEKRQRPTRPRVVEQASGRVRAGMRQDAPARCHGPTVGKDLAVVVEEHDPVAEKAPSLLGVARHDVRRVAVWLVDRRARRLVRAHLLAP